MASAGPNNPSSGTNQTGVGTVAWSNPGNITSSDNVYATASGISITTNYLVGTGFGFSIPSGSTIDGIVVSIERKASASGAQYASDNIVSLVKGGSIVGDNKAATGTKYPTSDASASYGSSTDLWGTTWSVSDINASNFGLALSSTTNGNVTISVDNFRITVYYTEGGGGISIPVVMYHMRQQEIS